MIKKIRYTLITLLAILIIIQFFPASKVNTEINQAKDFIRLTSPDAEITAILKSACYDCHSLTTEYPWYARIQPVGWWLKGHVKGGRKHLNFSTWGDYNPKKRAHKLEECIEGLEEGRMPLKSYTWTHDDAKLSSDQVEKLASWFKTI
jgi:hypothetical protein